MSTLPIELEIRGEIQQRDLPAIRARLRSCGFRFKKRTRRTSVMSFGITRGRKANVTSRNKNHVDVRCRVTNGKAEIVAKVGTSSAAHDRTEIAVPVSLQNMLSFTRLFASMNFFTKVGSRSHEDFIKGSITATLVWSASGLAYIELEKMSSTTNAKKDHAILLALGKELNLKLWTTKNQFYEFCDRLNTKDDWQFTGTDKDMKRLRKEIEKVGSGK